MIRLPTSHAAITAPLVASLTDFPGVPIGRSLLDGRAFHLSPVLTDAAILPSTNTLGMGGLGSGKSTTGKARIHREILHHDHQAVVIDSFGEDADGEWASLTRSLNGRVIDASRFTLNPCSDLFSPGVREQLLRSLIAAVEPGALTPQSTHALQHALTHPKASHLPGLVDALVHPENGRWPAEKLAGWGEGVAIALSRYTEGSLRGLFDGQGADLPETDLPIISFDFSRLDRNSAAIPSLMAAVSCWAEHVWLRQSTAVHRHLVLEEAWQILLSPATSELIQRLLKNSRKAGLSLDVLMHTISDLGDGRAQDLARLCEVVHVGRLGPEEAAIVGAILGLPAWAIEEIPNLDPGQAVWRVGPHYVDIIQTILSDDELTLTDTSTRRRRAQQAASGTEAEAAPTTPVALAKDDDEEESEAFPLELDVEEDGCGWDWEMPPNTIDTCYPADTRHQAVIRAAMEGRLNEAANVAAVGEREDITNYGINSSEAVSWLSTRAKVAELSGKGDQAAQLRATVIRMGEEVNWWEEETNNGTPPGGHQQPFPPASPAPVNSADESAARPRRRTWPYVAVVAALALAVVTVWQNGDEKEERQEHDAKAAAYKGVSAVDLNIDGVKTETVATWSKDGKSVILSAWIKSEEKAKFARIDSGKETAKEERSLVKKKQMHGPIRLEIQVPINDRYQSARLYIAVGGSHWKKGSRAPHRTVEFRPDRTASDTETGKALKQQYSKLL
ncbi:hypothetical protein ABZ953_39160 [Streptomyces sp. NPDC046465]|uniref:hypothetical protein n=1 Tax=Streptomyces sp. NPDC046465 TaxID=3155810 RepID=UPI0033D79E9C